MTYQKEHASEWSSFLLLFAAAAAVFSVFVIFFPALRIAPSLTGLTVHDPEVGIQATNVTGCQAITTAGDYELNASVSNGSTCFNILTDNVTLNCNGYEISYGNQSVGFGILAVGRSNITVRNCIIKDQNDSDAGSHAINFSSTNLSMIVNNTIQTNGTNSNYGVFLQNKANNNTVANNTVRARGTGNTNIGIYLTDSLTNTVEGNTIATNGTNSNRGISLLNVNRSLVKNNSIAANGTSNNNRGIALDTSDNNNVTLNTVRTNGTTTNDGIYVDFSKYDIITANTVTTVSNDSAGVQLTEAGFANVTFNILTTMGDTTTISANGIRVSSQTTFYRLESNTINVTGSSNGINLVAGSDNAAIINNTITTTSTLNIGTQGRGIYSEADWSNFTANRVTSGLIALDVQGENNTFSNNNLTGGSFAMTFISATNNTFRSNNFTGGSSYGIDANEPAARNIFIDNRIARNSGTSIRIAMTSASTSYNFTNTVIESNSTWLVVLGGSGNLSFENTTFESSNGSVRFPEIIKINVSDTVNATQALLNISFNRTFVNTSNLTFLNRSAVVTLTGLGGMSDPTPVVDFGGGFVNCSQGTAPQCGETGFSDGIFVFNATHFTVYAAIENDSLAPVINITSPANDTRFSADFNISENITDANLDYVIYNVSNGTGNLTQWINQSNQTPVQWTSLINISLLADGTYNITKLAVDAAGSSTLVVVGFAVDTVAPALSGEAATDITTASAVLQVASGEAATCRYDSSDVSYASMTLSFDSTGGTSHSTQVAGLGAGTSYVYYARCRDAAGNPSSSVGISFTTKSSGGGGGGGGGSSSPSSGAPSTLPAVAPPTQEAPALSVEAPQPTPEQAPAEQPQQEVIEVMVPIPPTMTQNIPEAALGGLANAPDALTTALVGGALQDSTIVSSIISELAIGESSAPTQLLITAPTGETVSVVAVFTPIASAAEEPAYVASAVAESDEALDVFVVLGGGAVETALTGALIAATGAAPAFTVELDLQKPAQPGYSPSLKLRGLLEALLSGPKTQYAGLYGPFGREGMLVAQRFRSGAFAGERTLEVGVVRGAALLSTHRHEVLVQQRAFEQAAATSAVPTFEILSLALSIMLIVFVEIIAVQLRTIAELRDAEERIRKEKET